jgi:hypothetical protein
LAVQAHAARMQHRAWPWLRRQSVTSLVSGAANHPMSPTCGRQRNFFGSRVDVPNGPAQANDQPITSGNTLPMYWGLPSRSLASACQKTGHGERNRVGCTAAPMVGICPEYKSGVPLMGRQHKV